MDPLENLASSGKPLEIVFICRGYVKVLRELNEVVGLSVDKSHSSGRSLVARSEQIRSDLIDLKSNLVSRISSEVKQRSSVSLDQHIINLFEQRVDFYEKVENTLSIIISLSSLDPSHQTYHLLQNASKKEFQATSESLRAFIVLATDFDRLSQEGHEQEKRFKIRDVAIQLFNTNFKLGLEYLAQKGVIDAQIIGAFLFNNRVRLGKEQLALVFGSYHHAHIDISKAFVSRFEFPPSFLKALRLYLGSFILRGEAQQIDRMLERFSEIYYQAYPTSFPDADACYVLSYSVIMLNTSIHNANCRGMTFENYKSNMRGLWGGEDPPEQLMSSIYEGISSEELKAS